MKKPFIILTAASVLALASCGGLAESSAPAAGSSEGDSLLVSSETPASSSEESSSAESSSSTSLPKITPSVELAAQKLEELKGKTLLHYLLKTRSYQDSYLDGTVMTNQEEEMEIHSYDGAWEGTDKVTQLTGILDTTPVSDAVGRIAGYYLDDKSFAYGSTWDDPSSNLLNITEVNRFQNPNVVEENFYVSFLDHVASAFEDFDKVYDPLIGYTAAEPVIEEEEGAFRLTLGATAPETDFYGREAVSVYCLLDAYTGEVVELGSTMLLYDMGYTDDDPNVSANNITNNTMVIYETGERKEGTVEPFDASLFGPENIVSTVSEKVDGLETGDLSEDSVKAVLSNIAAYAEGVTKDEFTVETSALTDTITYESLGPATGTGTATVDGDLYSESTAYQLADGSEVVQTVTNEAVEDGVKITATQNGEVVTAITTPGSYVLTWASYFTPGPFTATASVACSTFVLSNVLTYGFGDFGDDYTSGKNTLLEASNVEGVITISFESSSSSAFGTNENTLTIEIVDGILATVEGTSSQEISFAGISDSTIVTERHVLSAA